MELDKYIGIAMMKFEPGRFTTTIPC